MPELSQLLEKFPRAELFTAPTPLERMPQISEALGIDLWVKRDDLTGLAAGGNKARQLEYYFGEAEQLGADTVLITGAAQSNYALAMAAAARKLGMAPVVQLERRVDISDPAYNTSGNVLLGRILGSEFMVYGNGDDEEGADKALSRIAAGLADAGLRPFLIPLGPHHPPLGALGYMRAALEIAGQARDFDFVVVASGSGQTHAGLLAGFSLLGFGGSVIGSCVRRPASEQAKRIGQVLRNLQALLGVPLGKASESIQVKDEALEPGYGKPGKAACLAAEMAAKLEGKLLDPVYTAKSFATVIQMARSGEFPERSKVLFVHTGGLPALFGYREHLEGIWRLSHGPEL